MDLMIEQDWQTSFATFMANFGRFFKRAESRNSAAHYVRGLLADVKRKNCWQLAEMMGEAHPDRLQHLLYGADWDACCMGPIGMQTRCANCCGQSWLHSWGIGQALA